MGMLTKKERWNKKEIKTTNAFGKQIKVSYRISPCTLDIMITQQSSALKSVVALALMTSIGFLWLLLAEAKQYYLSVGGFCAAMLITALGYLYMADTIQERLILVPGFGLQLSSLSLLGRKTHVFVHYDRLEKIFIHEVISLHRVFYLLVALATKGEQDRTIVQTYSEMVPLFATTRPRLDVLQTAYKEISILVDSKSATRNVRS